MRNFILILTLLGTLLFSWSNAYAVDPAEKSEGFSGRISGGAGYMTSTDQLKTTDENKTIDSLNDDSDWYDKFIPLALFNLRYTFAESGRQVYFGTPTELSGPPGLSLGFVQPFSDGSKLDISIFTHLFSEVWRDPYLTNTGFGMFTRSDLFGKDYLYGTLMAGYRYRDCNIAFLEAQTFLSGAMIGIEF